MAIIGIDEVGRGCWAGPFVICGARIADHELIGLKDSKSYSKAKREKLSYQIKTRTDEIEIVWVSPQEIDQVGLTEAMKRACQTIFSSLYKPGDITIIDGTINFLDGKEGVEAMIKGDERVPAVAAASIVAKVARDNFMEQVAKMYKGYGFESHAGYGTKQHIDALSELGVCDIHRKSYKPIKKFL